jgi:hypothetical protein
MITSKGADVERLLIPGEAYNQGDVHARSDEFRVTAPPTGAPQASQAAAARRLWRAGSGSRALSGWPQARGSRGWRPAPGVRVAGGWLRGAAYRQWFRLLGPGVRGPSRRSP